MHVAVTHGHPVGALQPLLQAHPNAKVAAHADALALLELEGPRVLVLQGGAGDLADAGQLGGARIRKALRWLPHGVLR